MSDDAFPEEVARLVREYVEDRHDFLSWLNASVERIDSGLVVMSVPYDEKLTNRPPGWGPSSEGGTPSMHGGVAATLIDTAGGIAQRTTLSTPLAGGVVTVNLNVNYLRRATGDLTATAEVVRAGNTVGVSTVTVEGPTPEGGREPVATGQGAYRLFQSPREES
ncbi:MAG: PaaI family thioesterase [Salinigranum sp.]